MTLQAPGNHVSASATSRFAYDVFVVHADAPTDEVFVNGYLLANLGLAPERVLRLQTLQLGQSITAEIERGVRSSRVTIVVLSAAYMDDHWAAFGEQLVVFASVAKNLHGVLLPLLLEDCELTTYVQSLVRLDSGTRRARRGMPRSIGFAGTSIGPAAPESDLAYPYPGMRPFTKSDAGRFFGREVEFDNIEYRLRRGRCRAARFLRDRARASDGCALRSAVYPARGLLWRILDQLAVDRQRRPDLAHRSGAARP